MNKEETIEKYEVLLDEYIRLLERAEKESKAPDKRTREGAQFRVPGYKKEIKELEEKLANLKGEPKPEKLKKKTKKSNRYVNLSTVKY